MGRLILTIIKLAGAAFLAYWTLVFFLLLIVALAA
jgi:hypothetical protein